MKIIQLIFGFSLILFSLYLFSSYDSNSIVNYSFVNGLILGQFAVLFLWGFKEIIAGIINSNKKQEAGK